MKLSKIAARVEGVELLDARSGDVDVSEVHFDSRDVEPDALFVALEGNRADGHDYVDEAVEAGASAVMVRRGREGVVSGDVPTLAADRGRERLGPVSSLVYGNPSAELDVVGITGTNGKTTTCALLTSILESDGRAVGRVGTTGYRWPGVDEDGPNTTPESARLQRMFARMRDDGVDTVVMEVSSHGLATHRLRGTEFDVAVFTNFSQDHLDFHGDLESYRRAKVSLFHEYLTREHPRDGGGAKATLNVDDAVGAELAEELATNEAVEVVRFAVDDEATETGECDVGARNLEGSLDGIGFELVAGDESRRLRVPLVGRFNVENCVAAAAAGRASGVAWRAIVEGLEEFDRVAGRTERIDSPGSKIPAVFVDYAHTPDALERVLENVGSVTPGRLVAVFGCGGDRDREKRPEMGRIGASCADLTVVTSDNPRSEPRRAIVDQILDGIDEPVEEGAVPPERGVWVEVKRDEAIRRAIRAAEPGDAVVVAGKGHETYQEVDGRRREFDDRAKVADALDERDAPS